MCARRIILLMLVLVLVSTLASTVDAINHSSQNIHFSIAYGKVLVESEWFFTNGSDEVIQLTLPNDARAITVKLDGGTTDFGLDGNILTLNLAGGEDVSLSYITEDLLERGTFIASFNAPVDVDRIEVMLSLPEDHLLAKPVSESTVSSGAVFPKPTRMETNGRVIDIVWETNKVVAGDEFSYFAKYVKPGNFNFGLLVLLMLIFLGVLSFMGLKLRKYKPGKETPKRGVPDVTEHLKEDEAQIINVLKAKEGSCEQGTLRVVTGFSKASLSRLLKELEDRKLIHKEKRGKKNLVFLK